MQGEEIIAILPTEPDTQQDGDDSTTSLAALRTCLRTLAGDGEACAEELADAESDIYRKLEAACTRAARAVESARVANLRRLEDEYEAFDPFDRACIGSRSEQTAGKPLRAVSRPLHACHLAVPLCARR